MGNGKFADSILKKGLHQPANDEDVRDGLGGDRQQTGRAFDLELRFKDGRTCEALPWALYQRRRWDSASSESETLVLLFAGCTVAIEGEHLQRVSEMIRDERLEIVQEHDQAEVALIRSENMQLDPRHRRAVILGISIEPPFESTQREIAATEGR